MAPAASDCSTDTTLCLGESRFLVAAFWTKPDGESGVAHAVALTPDSGYFWFLDPNNVEVTVKALNGCGVDGHYWFFAAGLTNLQVQITVTDAVTNATKTYSNPLGTPFESIADTGTFAGCPAAATALSGGREPDIEAGAVTSRHQNRVFARPDSAAGCVTSDTTLCTGGRFATSILFDANGESRFANSVQLTPESGYFWFFDPSNIEIVVKTLNACSIGQGNWFFAAGMTDLYVLVSVYDTLNDTTTQYEHRPGSLFSPIQDTSAFPYCPGTVTHYTVPLTATDLRPPCSNGYFPYTKYAFSKDIHARVGDTVTWVWSDGNSFHSTTAADGSWDSGAHYGPFTFSHTFTEVGTFPYSCSVGHQSVRIEFPSPFPGMERGTCTYVEDFHEGAEVVVIAATTPTPSPTAAPSPTPTP